ncbi:MAG: transketolase [Alphaproteobacteria bacterium]|nr:transketolase [Alphaproteobacteria bacterium]
MTDSKPTATHKDMANAIRALAMDAVQKANSGHPGMPMGTADIATVLVQRFLKFDPANPAWPDRDRFVLSAGHGSMLLYALLYLTGYGDIDIEAIKNFRQLDSATAGHPEYGHAAGIETTTGPLGQGIANAVGMALAERMLAARFSEALVNHHTFVIVGDGCLMEGISHEAASLAGHLKLSRLIVLYDSNQISIDGPTSLSFSDDTAQRFAAYGWDTQTIDGHDPEAIAGAIEAAMQSSTPSLIICRTTIAYGAPTKAGTADSHGSPLGEAEIKGARERLGWPHAPFEIPLDILATWRTAGARGGKAYDAWVRRHEAFDAEARASFDRAITGELPPEALNALDTLKAKFSAEKPALATRVSSQKAIEAVAPALPELIGGSADLTGSNGTKVASLGPVTAEAYGGRYIYYGVREHGMAAAMNGVALHGGLIPFGGTFLVFADYCRPAIRLSALMGIRVIYVMTHDSIGLGEDGPTHQPVEHLASLRAMPNLLVLRPADAVETAECWQIALAKKDGPSVLALTRQNLPTLRAEHVAENRAAKGGYILQEASNAKPRVVLLATGSEVSLAAEARTLLEAGGVPTRVVSLPSFELFDAQPEAYRNSVLGGDAVRIGVEAAVRMGWDRYLGANGAFIGMASFGASAPIKALYQRFGITSDAIVKAAKERL